MNIRSNRAIAAAAAAAIALTSVSFTPATAAPVSKSQTVAQAGDLEVGARRRHYRGGGGNGAAAAAMLGIIGTIAGIAAADAARSRYNDGYYAPHRGYGYGPGYGYAPPPRAYYRSYPYVY